MIVPNPIFRLANYIPCFHFMLNMPSQSQTDIKTTTDLLLASEYRDLMH